MSEWVDATVTSVDPFRVTLDGALSPLSYAPDTLISPSLLSVSDRVRCELSSGRVVVHGRADGLPVPVRVPREFTWSTGSSVAAGAEVEVDVTLPREGAVWRVVTSAAARVRLYDRAAASTADASRASGVMPVGDHGVIVELDGATGAEDVHIYPAVPYANGDGTDVFKMRVKNLGVSSAVITGSIWVIL